MGTKDRQGKALKGGNPAALPLVDAAAMQTALDLAARGKTADAAKMLEDIARRNPANATAPFNLGMLCYKAGSLAEAEKSFRKALARNPEDGETLAYLAGVRLDRGAHAEGLELWEKAKCHPLSARSWVTIGGILRELGDIPHAKECFETALALQPDCIEAFYGISRVRKFTTEELAAMRRIANVRTTDEKIKLEFSLGKAGLDNDEAEEGFRHYAEANRLKKSTRPVDISLYEKYADSLIGLFSQDVVRRLRGRGSVTSSQPVFIVGMMRSGSTLTDQILSSHPDVRSVGEAEYFVKGIPAYTNTEVPGHFRAGAPSITREFIDKLTPDVLDTIGRKYLSLTAPAAQGATRVIDKMLHNFFWVGLIRLALPNAKIIHTTRDPVDTGLSLYTLLFTSHLPWTYDQRDIGRYILSCNRVMDHWKKLFPGAIYEANYERMIADQESETRKLLEFCGLPWNDSCLKFHETKRQVNTASATQVRQPIYKDSVKKWKKYEQYLQPLIKTLEGGE
ncbi:MAG: sulfotransferase family protein [Alphaproteobacteria bacterium]|nr:MAG: sulfotransferase family protein [Alphaproteobacteria bacterium]